MEKSIPLLIRTSFEEECSKIASAYAEERRLIQWIEEVAAKGELNVDLLSEEANKRAYLLTVKKAEDAVTLAQTSLSRCKRTIEEEQKTLFESVKLHFGQSTIDGHKKALKELSAQEKILEERARVAQANLDALKLPTT